MKTGQRRKRYVCWKRNPYKKRIKQKAKGLEYAFVSSAMEQATDFVRNPDFLLSAMWGNINKTRIERQGYKYDPDKHPEIRKNKVALLIANPHDDEFHLRIPGVLDFVNQIEYDLSIARTNIRGCYNPPIGYNDVWYVEGSRRWANAPTMLSFYTLCIAVGMVHEPGAIFRETIEAIRGRKLQPYSTEDITTWDYAEAVIEKLLHRGDKNTFFRDIRANYPYNLQIGDWEDGHKDLSISGMAYYTRRYAATKTLLVPYWPVIPLSG